MSTRKLLNVKFYVFVYLIKFTHDTVLVLSFVQFNILENIRVAPIDGTYKNS